VHTFELSLNDYGYDNFKLVYVAIEENEIECLMIRVLDKMRWNENESLSWEVRNWLIAMEMRILLRK
jgi:hypothetical protein